MLKFFSTKFTSPVNGKKYAGIAMADSWDNAQAQCDARGINEKVDGELMFAGTVTPDGPRTEFDFSYEEPDAQDESLNCLLCNKQACECECVDFEVDEAAFYTGIGVGAGEAKVDDRTVSVVSLVFPLTDTKETGEVEEKYFTLATAKGLVNDLKDAIKMAESYINRK